MPTSFRMRSAFALAFFVLAANFPAFAQMETATLNGVVSDPKGGVVPDVEVVATRIETGTVLTTKTNGAGIYFFTSLMPGHYHLVIRKPGFKEIAVKEIELHVQDKLERNFSLEIGSISETVTVTGGTPLINTESAAVSTVVDRQFAENLPLNGRSFQTLIQLTPGVVLTAANQLDSGQFSVNGQRGTSNYWTVDGVSANIGINALATPGQGLGGTLGSFSAFGGTNSLVSVDALQEFRIQTSTYAPEFGRVPGGQISIVTRSGTNQFHGTAFDYLRNDIFDANNWFNTSVTPQLRKAEERQNDFGGTFSGPLLKDRTFFFFSYEGLRLRLPQTQLTKVPDVAARQNAIPAMQTFLNAYPLPNGLDNPSTGVAQFNSSFSNPGTLDAYSLRIDHKVNQKLSFFGRYNYSPSEFDQRGSQGGSLSTISLARITTQTGTAGLTWAISPTTANDFRFNYSSTDSFLSNSLDNFGGAVPPATVPFPSGFSTSNASFNVVIFSLGFASGQSLFNGKNADNFLRQINLVDSVSVQKGRHTLKFGGDYRRLSPEITGFHYTQTGEFLSVPRAETGKSLFTLLISRRDVTFLLQNLGMFLQDTWRINPRLTATYGIRWDVDFAPSATNGPSLPAVVGFSVTNLSQLNLAPTGTPPFNTRYANLAPRVGVAYQLSQSQNWQTVLRGGYGVFYDLATAEMGNILPLVFFPYGALKFAFGSSFPLTGSAGAPPAITFPPSLIAALDPNLRLPYTHQWNVALEQAIGTKQTITASYVGSTGRRLIQTAVINGPNPNFVQARVVTNAGTSDYNALQLQFQRRLSRGLQALASYTWSHSIDTASAGSTGSFSNALTALGPNVNRGPSDFDIRNAFSVGLTYDVPAPKINAFTNAILRGWSLQNVIQVRSAPPVDLFDSAFFELSNGFQTNVRPDVVPGVPLYLFGAQFPGGRAFNNTLGAVAGGCPDGSQSIGPFCPPPTDANGNPLRQGNLGRNALRAFGATQWDFAIHRDFPFHESLKLQFRAEMFNVLNHPNFGPPVADISDPRFGQSIQLLGQSLSGASVGVGPGSGAFNPLYQIGGPRSIQLALKLTF
jgi:Carboxypeptidase regulatory-like domain